MATSFQSGNRGWSSRQNDGAENNDKREGKNLGNGDKMDSRENGQAQTKSDTYKHARSHTHTHIHTPTLWFMQTESVSSRDLSSPEGLRENQTEYLRQASLIPLVRLKSHTCKHTHTHTHTHTHDSKTKQDITKFVCLCTSVFIFLRVHCYSLYFHFRISKALLYLSRIQMRAGFGPETATISQI